MAELLKYEQTEISYRGRPAVTDISFTLREGEILGIVGDCWDHPVPSPAAIFSIGEGACLHFHLRSCAGSTVRNLA